MADPPADSLRAQRYRALGAFRCAMRLRRTRAASQRGLGVSDLGILCDDAQLDLL